VVVVFTVAVAVAVAALLTEELSQETLAHLRWLMQKDSLAQDVFLVGDPGPERRRLIMAYCELVGREVEVR
jgi:hypothetical protein